MTVRAKFQCIGVKQSVGSVWKPEMNDGKGGYESGIVHTIEMTPVYGKGDPGHENTKFWQASPSGSLSLNCVNPAAVAQFEVGKEYYLDFTPAG